jgi:type II secretory pathway pseudopilin PulG
MENKMEKWPKIGNKRQEGQSLLEVLTALGVAVIIIVALSILAVSSLRNAQHARAQAEATKYVNGGLEQVRTVRDRQGWSMFFSYAVPKCYSVQTSDWTLQEDSSCSGVPVSGHIRTILLEDQTTPEGEGRKVTVTVSWTDSFGPNTSSATTILTKWK